VALAWFLDFGLCFFKHQDFGKMNGWIKNGDIINTEFGPCIVLNVTSNLFGQVIYDLELVSDFWKQYEEHGNGD
jgi:hypothetical protein